jgi:hypothetical protein
MFAFSAQNLAPAGLPSSAPEVQNRAANILFRDQHVSSSQFKPKKKSAFGFTQFGDLSSPFVLASWGCYVQRGIARRLRRFPRLFGAVRCEAKAIIAKQAVGRFDQSMDSVLSRAGSFYPSMFGSANL